jgi:hypothetical protein
MESGSDDAAKAAAAAEKCIASVVPELGTAGVMAAGATGLLIGVQQQALGVVGTGGEHHQQEAAGAMGTVADGGAAACPGRRRD